MKTIDDGTLDEVLIETYWNVKMVTVIKNSGLFSINRNILECKVVWNGISFEGSHVLIETYWNVKCENKCGTYCSRRY